MKFGFFLGFFLVSHITFWAQSQPVERAEFFRLLNGATDRSKTYSYRRHFKGEYSRNGAVEAESEELYEWVPSGDFRHRIVKFEKGKRSVEEIIKVGDRYFCRKDSSGWTVSEKWCGPSTFRAIPGTAKSSFTKESTGLGQARVTIFRWYATYTFPERQDEVEFMDSKTWIDEIGRVLKEESRMGILGSAHRDYLTSEWYEYDSRITIRVPVR